MAPWTVNGVPLGNEHRPALMGIVNLSPEAFYPGSVQTAEGLVDQGLRLVAQGASWVDIGVMSTNPGAEPLTADGELERYREWASPGVKALASEGVRVSIDTQRKVVAEAALSDGCVMVNDISGFNTEPPMAKVVADHGASAVLMAAGASPGDTIDVKRTVDALERSAFMANRAGVEEMVLDIGIGKWVPEKTAADDVSLIVEGIEHLGTLGRPILVGISRKSMFDELLGLKDPADRLEATLAATGVAVSRGAHVVRTHDVLATDRYLSGLSLFE